MRKVSVGSFFLLCCCFLKIAVIPELQCAFSVPISVRVPLTLPPACFLESPGPGRGR